MKRGLMKGKLMKRLLVFLTALSMMLGMVQTAAAYDAGQKGSISITLVDEDGENKTPLQGVTLDLYKVGTIVNQGGALSFTVLQEFSADGEDLSTFQFANAEEARRAADKLAAIASSSGIVPVQEQTTGTDGGLVFDGLEQGMYLLLLNSKGDSIYGELSIQPTLLSVPFANVETGEWSYNVTASPKVEIKPPAPTATPIPTATPGPIETPAPTVTPGPIETPDPYVTPEPSPTPTPTVTPSPTPTVTPEPTPTPDPGSITVTKQVNFIDSDFNIVPMVAVDTTYTVGLYLDSAGTIPYGDGAVQQIHVQGTSSGSVNWSNVPDGTYYLFELDANGNKIGSQIQQVEINGQQANLQSVITNEQGSSTNNIEVSGDNSGRHFYVNNNYYELPEGFFVEGRLNITKNVLVNGQAATVDDTFYAGVFSQAEDGTLELVKVVTLQQNGSVEVVVPVKMDGEEVIPTEYFVYETDSEGNLLDKDVFEYAVSGECAVTITRESTNKNVVITNSKEVEVTPTPEQTTPNGGGGGANYYGGGTTSRTSVRTGDDTPIALYVIIILIAAAVIGGVVIRRRKQERK